MPNPKKQEPSKTALWLRKVSGAPRARTYQPGKTKQVVIGSPAFVKALVSGLTAEVSHVVLSQVISKYIGETEKNLKAVFKAAEDKNVVLFFDEADALFGARTDVRDSHDRYAKQSAPLFKRLIKNYKGTVVIGLKQCGK